MVRRQVIELLAAHITSLQLAHPVRVVVDGVDAAGKTTLADELIAPLASGGRPVIRASVDGFHRPRAERYRQGRDAPSGYYEDAFDYPALRAALLLPLGPDGSRRYRRAAFDFLADAPVSMATEEASANSVLLFDGVFLLRRELDDQWDYRIFVDVPFAIALERATERDQALFGSPQEVRARYLRRYIPGQRLYLEEAQPRSRAQALLYNADPAHPHVTFAK